MRRSNGPSGLGLKTSVTSESCVVVARFYSPFARHTRPSRSPPRSAISQGFTSTRTPSPQRPRGRSAAASGASWTAASSDRRLTNRERPGSTSRGSRQSGSSRCSGWTKGSAALLLAVRALAQAEGVEEKLLEEWQMSMPHLPAQSVAASRSALTKGWRWVGEMGEIASSHATAGLPDGFHRAAAEIYRRASGDPGGDNALEEVLAAIRNRRGGAT